jgi:hypothetical protein
MVQIFNLSKIRIVKIEKETIVSSYLKMVKKYWKKFNKLIFRIVPMKKEKTDYLKELYNN